MVSSPAAALPAITPTMGFDEASRIVVDFLKDHVPMGYWAVTRYDGYRQLYLEVRDDVYGLGPGGSHAWSDSFCVHMVDGKGPQIAPDAASVPAYASAPVGQAIDIGSYVGIPIVQGDGQLFGTICGLDPSTQDEALEEHSGLLTLLSNLLSMILDADRARTDAQRLAERAEIAAETDVLTGLLNRRGWDRAMEMEEDRYRRFGDPGAVIVIDLDQLKEINDTQGHAAGDTYIRTAGRTLAESLPEYDYIARIGGDEFGIMATETTPEQTTKVVARINAAFEAAGVAGAIGAAPYTIVAGFPGAFEAADKAMYEEKRRRRAAAGDRRRI